MSVNSAIREERDMEFWSDAAVERRAQERRRLEIEREAEDEIADLRRRLERENEGFEVSEALIDDFAEDDSDWLREEV